MQRESPRHGQVAAGGTSVPTFDSKLEHEEDVLDGLVARLGRGQLPADTWGRLHEAALRDARLAELAFAYEAVAQGKRLRALPPMVVADFNFQAATFFGDVFGDEFGAITYLDRALQSAPGHLAAFEKLAGLLTKTQAFRRLGELYMTTAQHRPRAEQADLLRVAADLFERTGGLEEKAIEIHQQLVRLDPHDQDARAALEARYLRANRVRDVVRLLEQALATEPPPDDAYARRVRARLIELYSTHLHEPERSIAHIEALLALDPGHADAQRVAGKLLVIKGIAARAAAALAAAHEQLGHAPEVARLLAIELEHTRGPKRRDVLRRLGILKQDRLHDPVGAYETFEAALGLDPADDDLRRRYAETAAELHRQLDAARTLSRVGMMVKDAALRARLSSEMGELLLAGGDAKKARATFVSVLAAHETDNTSTLGAARALTKIYASEKDPKALAPVLERVSRMESDPDAKRYADEQLAELYSGVLGEPLKAIVAWQRLVDTPARERALSALEGLYASTGGHAELASVLDERAKDARTPLEARALLVRAAEVLTEIGEGTRASAAWRRVAEKFGAARDIHAMWIPLLEAQKQWEGLAEALAAEAQLAPESERPALYARLGAVALTRLRDVPTALEAYRRVLAIDAADKTARGAVEKLLASGEHRLAASAVLEPIYRREGNVTALLRVLEARATLGATPEVRLAALEEARRVSEASPAETTRALEFVGRGLVEAVAAELPFAAWLAAVERLAGTHAKGGGGGDVKRSAMFLAKALGDRAVTSPELFALAVRAGELLATSGDIAGALGAFRGALAFDPSSGDLVARVDSLLREEGSPVERVALHRAAVARETDPARLVALHHTIGSIERRDLLDKKAAIATYRAALAIDPSDREAHLSLVELFSEIASWVDLTSELERHLGLTTGEEAWVARTHVAEVAAQHGQRDRARAHARALLAEELLPPAYLEQLARVAERIDDLDLTCDVLRRRARDASEAHEEIGWLETLGVVQLEQRGDPATAAGTWRVAARAAAAAGDFEGTRRLYERVRSLAPADEEAALRLADVLERAEDWAALPSIYEVLETHAHDATARVDVLVRLARVYERRLGDLAGGTRAAARAFAIAPADRAVLEIFERLATASGALDTFATAVDVAVDAATNGGALAEDLRVDLALAKARALASDPERRATATATYRALLDAPDLGETQQRAALSAFATLLENAGDDAAFHDDRRWLLAWRAKNLPEAERLAALVAWAAAEENVFGNLARALELQRRILDVDPEGATAMAAIARLSLATDDVAGAIDALTQRRERSEGAARNALDLEIAAILVERGGDLDQALGCVSAVLENAPHDPAARELAARLLGLPAARARAVELLERTLDATEDEAVRAEILGKLLAGPAPSSASAPAETARRRVWHERLLDLHAAEGRSDRALETALRALEELPSVDGLWDRAEALAREREKPDDVARMYQTAIDLPLAREDALALGQRAVAFFEEWFEDPAGVVRILERVLEIDPAASWAFERLKLIFNAAEQWEALFQLYDRALSAASGAAKIELLEDAAQVAKDFAGNAERAIAYLQQLHALKPHDARLIASLERLYERHGRHRELIALLGAQATTLTPAAAHKVRLRIAALWLNEVGDAPAALATVEDAIARAPGSDVEPDVCELLEKIVARAPAGAEVRDPGPKDEAAAERRRESQPPGGIGGSGAGTSKRPLVRQRAASLLRERYTEPGRESELARVLEIELEAVRNVKERIRRHHQVAQIHARLGNDRAAFEHFVALVLLEPDVEGHRRELGEIAKRTRNEARLAEVLATAAEECADARLRIELLMDAATVHADVLDDGARAIDLFLRALALSNESGADAATALAAARRVEPLLAAAGRGFERLDVLERIAVLEPAVAERRPLLFTTAQLAAKLAEPERAIAAYEAVLRDDAEDIEALDGLVALLERESRFPALIDALARRARAPIPKAWQRRDRVQIAHIYRYKMSAIDDAIEAWRAVEKEFGEEDECTEALAELFRSAGRAPDLEAILRRAAERADAPATRAVYLRRLGDVQRQDLGARADAAKSYEAALAADVAVEGAREGLHALLDDPAQRAFAVGVLARICAATDDFRAALALTEHRLTAAPDDLARVSVLLDTARIAEERLAEVDVAFSATRRAFLLAPARDEIRADLARLAVATKQLRAYADTLHEAIEAVERTPGRDNALLVRLHTEKARVLEEHLDDPRAALTSYLRVAADVPDSSAAAHAAVRLAAWTERWEPAARVILEHARATGRTDAALLAYVEDAARTPAGWDGAAAALGATLAALPTEGPDATLPAIALRDLEARLGAWHRDRRGDADAAEAAFTRALAADPQNAQLLGALATLQRRGRGRPLVDSLLRLSQATGGDLDLLHEAAEIALGAVGDRALARPILERLLRLASERWVGVDDDGPPTLGAPTSPAPHAEWALAELVRLYEDEGEAARVVDLLVQGARLPFAVETTRKMRHDAAHVALERLGDHERAAALYLALVDEDADDEVAASKLVALYRSQKQTSALLALRKRQIARAPEAAKRVALRRQVAALLLEGEEPELAVAALRENLDEAPRDPETVAELAHALEGLGHDEALRELFAEQAELAEDDEDADRAAELWARAAEVAEHRCGDATAAIAHHERVVALRTRAASLDALARLESARGDFAATARHLAALLPVAGDDVRSATTLRLADALERAGRSDLARAHLEAEAELDAAAAEVWARLAAMYRASEDFLLLARLLARAAAQAPDKAARLARLREAADLYRVRCDDPASAVPLLEQASDLDPDSQQTRLSLADAMAEAGRFDEARSLLRILIDGYGNRRPKERAPVHYHLAKLELRMGDRARALVELDVATRIDPANPQILLALAELARDDGQLDRAERSYRALLVVLRRQDGPTASDNATSVAAPGAPVARSEVLLELCAIAERQGDETRAAELLESALETAGRSASEAFELERALRAKGRFAALAPRYAECLEALARAARAQGAGPLESALLVRLASVAEDDLGDDARAAATYEEALAAGVSAAEILRRLDRAYERTGVHDAQARVLERRVALATESNDAAGAAHALFRLAALRFTDPRKAEQGCELIVAALEASADYDRAEEALRHAIDVNPTSEPILALYEKIGRQEGHERALLDALTRRASLPLPSADVVREAVDLAARRGEPALAERLLRGYLELAGEVARDDDRAWALDTLAGLRLAAADVGEAVALKGAAADLADAPRAHALRLEIANLAATTLGDLPLAAATYESLLERDPADRETWEPLLEVYRRLGDGTRLVAHLATVVEHVSEPAERSRLRFERVRVLMSDLGMGDAAAEPLREIVDEDPSQVEAAILLAGILERRGDEHELAELLARQLDAAKDRSDAASVASLARRLGGLLAARDPEGARAVYVGALEWEPQSRELLRALLALPGHASDASQRADVMERLLALEQGEQAETLALELSILRTETWDDPGAERALEMGYKAHPASATLRERLEATYKERGAWAQLAELHALHARACDDPAERVARFGDAARIYRRELRDGDGAALVLREALAAQPGNAAILSELVELLAEAGNLAAAEEELTRALDGAETRGGEDARHAQLLAQRSELRAHLGDDAGALADLDAAFQGGAVDARALVARLVEIRTRLAERGDAATARSLALRLAELLPQIGDLEQSRTLLGDLVKTDGKDRDALRALGRLEEGAERWDAASAAYRRLVALEEGLAVVDTALRLADACERANRFADARGGLERARLIAPADEALRSRLERLYQAIGAFRELAEMQLADAKLAREVAGRFAALVRAGAIFLEHGPIESAIDPLKEAHALRPADVECTALLADALGVSGRAAEAHELLTAAVASHKGRRSRELAPLYHRLARTARAAGDRPGEMQWLATALDMDAQNGAVASELSTVAFELGQLELAQRALRAITMLRGTAPISRALAYQRLGEIARQQGDLKRAALLLKRAVDDDPTLDSARALLASLEIE